MASPTVEDDGATQFAFWLRFWRWVVALQQIVGGACGIYLASFGPVTGSGRVFLLIFFAGFTAAIWGGVLLARNRPGGVTVSLVVQAFQVLQIVSGYFLYLFGCGVQLLVGLASTASGPDVMMTIHFPAQFTIFLNSQGGMLPGQHYVAVNAAAILSIICLLYVRAEGRTKPPLDQPHSVPPPPHAHDTKTVWPPPPET